MAIAIFELIRHSTLIADDAQTYMIANIVFVLMVDTRALSMIRRPISTSKNNEDEYKMVWYEFLEALRTMERNWWSLRNWLQHGQKSTMRYCLIGLYFQRRNKKVVQNDHSFLTWLHYVTPVIMHQFLHRDKKRKHLKSSWSHRTRQTAVRQHRNSLRDIRAEQYAASKSRK